MSSEAGDIAAKRQLSFDHAVIVVPGLDAAIANFQALGFQVQRGGTNGPTHNALIYFRDGTYIELITPISRLARMAFRGLYALGILGWIAGRRPSIMARFLLWFGAPAGLRDWCIRSSCLDDTLKRFGALGVATTSPRDFSRTRPDGEVAKWRLAGPVGRHLPFLIEDISPTQIRVPFQDYCDHANGVTGISAVVLPGAAGLTTVQTLQRLVSGEVTGDTACEIGPVTIRYDQNPSPAGLVLELGSSGKVKGPLAQDKTFGAQIIIA